MVPLAGMPSRPEIRRERRDEAARKRPAVQVPKRKCDNCGTLYTPNPKRKQHRFCKPECRKSFHRNGTAFPALEEKLRKIVAEQIDHKREELSKMIEAARQSLKEIRKIRSEVNRILKGLAIKPRQRK